MNKKNTLISISLLFLAVSACKNQDHTYNEILAIKDFGSPIALIGDKVASITNEVPLYGLTDCGDYLLSRITTKQTYAFKLIRKSDFQEILSICPLGEGPEEYFDPTECEYSYSTDNVLILESDKSLLREINITESLQAGNTVAKSQSSYRKSGKRIWNLFVSNSGKQLAYILESGYFSYYEIQPEKQLLEKDLRSNPIKLAELYKPNAIYISQSLSTFNPQKGVAFVSYENLRRFDLISIDKGLLKIFYFNEKKTPNEAAEAMGKLYQWYNWDIASTKEYIYLGYALEERKSEEEELEQTHILVFDWEGNPVKHLVLPIPAKSFAVSQDGKKLYTLNESETQPNSISVYDIK
ncbi:BF3164 family lipoprotein [Porphyromonas gingivalis]|uniref:BF3164 family lipoprotein n=2 Tax=Porphyromonas gingivalis TaxID=837 RepID=UPI00097A38A6|nr:BF3164 family lipoprotein [Porphyromonas gingivalis]ATR99951.1 hypothetical protein CS549_02010 [Porphyromonas gingivalis]SJL28856.1 hypothetical protein PGIN_A7A1-28_01000 [Porphyromonas gingivalis]